MASASDDDEPGRVRRTLGCITDFIFLDPFRCGSIQTRNCRKIRHQEYSSSLPLQMALYFNVFYFPIWFLVEIIMISIQCHLVGFTCHSMIAVYIIFILGFEILRLYMAYVGNLLEKVPELAGFWLVTLALQFPLVMLVLFLHFLSRDVLQIAVTLLLFTFVVVELFLGYYAVKYMANNNAAMYQCERIKSDVFVRDPFEECTCVVSRAGCPIHRCPCGIPNCPCMQPQCSCEELECSCVMSQIRCEMIRQSCACPSDFNFETMTNL